MVRPGFLARRIASDGTPLGSEEVILPWTQVGVSSLMLAQGGEDSWMGAVESGRGILGARIAPEVAAGPVEVLVPWPELDFEFIDPTGLAATDDGFLIAWQFGAFSNILPPPCLDGQAVRAQEFGPAPLVAVPAVAPAGLIVLTALIALAALLLLRRP